MRVTIDFETKSFADLSQVGAWNYSLDATTDIICLCYKIDDGEVGEWVPGSPMPEELRYAIMSGCETEAHNYAFELGIWQNIAVPRYGFCSIMPSQWRCSMAVAQYYAMPAALDALCRALGMPAKDPGGKRLISKYSCLYLKTAQPVIPPADLRAFIDYCKRDVEIEHAVSNYLGDLPERELEVFQLDQRINMRGLFLDRDGIAAATVIVDQRSKELMAKFGEITGLAPTQGAKVAAWCEERGVKLDNMQAAYLEDLLEGDTIPAGEVRDALTIRLQVNKASTKKLDAMDRHTAPNGRALWQSRYHGAGTGRWTGSGFQPLNLVRSWEDVPPDELVANVMLRDPEWLDMLYGDAMEAVSKAGRHWIMAQPGNTILAADFVSIEAVILAVLAGEEWKIDAFRNEEFIYGMTGAMVHKLDPALLSMGKTKKASKAWFKEHYATAAKDGKTLELACGYQGSLGAWLKFDTSGRYADEEIVEKVKLWREKHPATVAFWKGLEEASLEAVANPGRRTQYRDIGFEIVDEWLSLILPNEKRIWYREPELRTGMPQWHKPETNEDCAAGCCKCRPTAKLTYMAQKEGQWKRVSTYGGKLAENACQATSREYLIPSIKAAEKAGYPVILTVYDEIVAEVPAGHGSLEEFNRILKHAPGRDWAKDYPIGVDGWAGSRYRK